MKSSPLWQTFHRHFNAWQRNRPRWIRRRVFSFPPVESHSAAAQLVVLCEAKRFAEGCWSAWSWLRFLHPHLRLHLFVDGTISGAQRRVFTQLFPGALLSELPAFLSAQPAPSDAFRAFLGRNWTARKLAMILHLQRTGPLLYSDCDVLALKSPEALLEQIVGGREPAFMEDGEAPCVDPWLRAEAHRLSLPLLDTLNSGLLWIPSRCLDEGLVEALLADWRPELNNHFSEQTLLAVLLGASGAKPLPRGDYLVSSHGWRCWDRDLPRAELTVRHYVGTVRHRMYSSAYPWLAQQAASTLPASHAPFK